MKLCFSIRIVFESGYLKSDSHYSCISCSTLTVLSVVGDKKIQRADQDANGFVNSEEEAWVKVGGSWVLQLSGGVCRRHQAHFYQLCKVLQGKINQSSAKTLLFHSDVLSKYEYESFFNLFNRLFAFPVQASSEVGSAGLYLEDYFEEQLKLVYSDKVFPGGREEQMIPPLEDEIDEEEEEMTAEGIAPLEDDKQQSPVGEGIPPVEEDLAPLEEAAALAEEEKPETEEEAIDTSDKGTDKKVAAKEEVTAPAEEAEQQEKSPEQEVKSSAASVESETKDGEASSSPKEENPQLSMDKTEDPAETQKESAPADTAKEEEEG